ncbi:MAG TPA: DUF6794 domain-containing protein [Pyrinomonadaceae bacterium]|nr:DUF6794 domain-containing protein [Pyrinomonadaceae bacterium]
MKLFSLTLAVLLCAPAAAGQAVSGGVEVVTVYSQNGRFRLKSVPYDDVFPSLRGKTHVYEAGAAAPLYSVGRAFDAVEEDSNNLVLSDDGQVIFYAITWGADEEREGLRSVNIYRRGELLKSYTMAEVTGCDAERERCGLVYSNYDEVVDKHKSRWGTPQYRKAFKAGAAEEEKFLSDFPIFASGDKVYLTDPRKQVHVFDLRDGSHARAGPFSQLYPRLKGEGRFTRTELEGYDAPSFLDFPRLRDGRDTQAALAARLRMKPAGRSGNSDERFRWYAVELSGYLRRDGRLEIEEMEVDEGLPKDPVAGFFRAARFDARRIPPPFEKWYFEHAYFFLRKSDDRTARRERREELVRQRAEYERRLTLETINGVYIPKNLGEALAEMDKRLTEVDKKEMRALPSREGMIVYHLGPGMWMRNNWGLWGGSRLQKYFTALGVTHPENMSTIILYHYHDWLNGRRETWKEWEKRPARR